MVNSLKWLAWFVGMARINRKGLRPGWPWVEQITPRRYFSFLDGGLGSNIRQGMPDSLITTLQGTVRDLNPMARQA